MPTLAGTKLDKYEMLEEVGHGGMAVVYRANDSVLRREVAVKVLHPHLADREECRLRLQREAIAVANLRHPNILEIYDYSGTEHPESYIVTEFIHGPTLREWIDEQLEPRPAIAALLIHRLCLALAQAHKGGIIHRDIKPENVMIRTDDGRVKLMDFGIAQILDDQKLTLTGQLIGSPAYMAPELISGKPLDARTDLFSLGIMLYQLATGELPFSGRNPHEVLNRIADGDYPPPSTLCPLVDQDLEAIIDKSLATSADDRYQTVDAFGTELEGYLNEMGIEPDKVELGRYFAKPEAFIAELDERVCKALMERARAAAKEGRSGRAIRLLGRVLEIDAGHGEARSLLARLRTRERRMRQALTVVGVVAVGGLVTAGIMLLPPERASTLEPSAFGSVPTPGMGALNIPAEDDNSGADVTPAPAATTDTAVDADKDAADPTDGSPAASQGTGPSDKANTDAGDKTARVAASTSRRSSATRTAPTMQCTLKIEGISVSSLRNLDLLLDGKAHEVDKAEMQFTLNALKPHTASIRSATYKGRAQLDRASCGAGPVVLHAEAKPARFNFDVPTDTSVRCVKGCKDDDWHLAKDFPEISLEGGQMASMTFELRRRGHEPVKKQENIKPGLNTIGADFKPLARP